jgi:monoamine oxidase
VLFVGTVTTTVRPVDVRRDRVSSIVLRRNSMTDNARESERASTLSRRRLLAGGLGLATAPLAIAAGPSTGESAGGATDYDVIIIGAGFCGVTAARECRRSGYRTLLLEARNRVGGRTFTTKFDGQVVEFGGSWVHWSQPYVWTELKRFGLRLRESSGATADKIIVHTSKRDIVTLSNAKVGAAIDKVVAKYMGDSRDILPLPHDPFGSDAYMKLDGVSSAERLESLKGVDPVYRDAVDAFQAAQGSNYNEKFAWLEMVRWFALSGYTFEGESDATGRFLISEGTGSLLERMMAEAGPELKLATPVRRVIQDNTGVTVITASGDVHRARAVVSTVPLNVLKDIEWQPALSEAQLQASSETHAGIGTKVHVLLEGDYGNITCYAPNRNAINWMNTQDVGEGKTHLIGFGPDPELLNVNDTESVQSAVRLFIPDAKVVRCSGYEWTLDPYSRGTWCTLRPGMWSKYLYQLQKTRGRVIFASADWANGWRGFIDGAIEQGLEAGRQLRALFG